MRKFFKFCIQLKKVSIKYVYSPRSAGAENECLPVIALFPPQTEMTSGK